MLRAAAAAVRASNPTGSWRIRWISAAWKIDAPSSKTPEFGNDDNFFRVCAQISGSTRR